MNTRNLFILVLFMFIPTLCYAWGIEINGIYYSLDNDNKTACVESGHGVFSEGIVFNYYSGDVVLPETVDYQGTIYTVASIRGGHENSGYMPYNAGPFENSNITSIRIPKTIKTIEAYTFNGSKSLVSVIFEGNVESIGNGAFKGCSSIESFEIPEGVETLNYETFEGCSSLESLTIPTTLKEIGGYMGGFDNLKALKIKDLAAWCNVSIFGGSMENPLYYAQHLYLNGEEVKELVIPQEVTVIGNDVFSGCEGITSVEFHKGVESIGWRCFSDCNNLETITIRGFGTKIKEQAFHNCSKLKDIYCDTEKCPDIVREYDFDESTYENATLHVKDYAVESFKADETWSKFKHFDVEKVTDFKLAYYVDGEIYKTELHKYEDEITPEPNPTKKGHTFSGWSDIPATMPGKDVDVKGSFGWSKITKDKVVYQVRDTLNNYSAVIGNDNASGMITIAPDIDFDYSYKVTSIVDKAFNGCKGITSIDIPATITSIGERAFANIDKLTDVTIYAEAVPETDRTAFESSYIDYVTLHVPYCSVDKYKSVGPWKDFKEIVAIEGTEPVTVETCSMPTISFLDGKLEFESETDGAECHYEIKVEDAKEGVGSEVILSSAYEISVYASKEGFNDSEKNIATLYWINVDPTKTGVIDNEMRVNTNSILVRNSAGSIFIAGVGDSEDVLIYNVSGHLIAKGKTSGNQVEISTNLTSGDICIIKIGDKSVKYILR